MTEIVALVSAGDLSRLNESFSVSAKECGALDSEYNITKVPVSQLLGREGKQARGDKWIHTLSAAFESNDSAAGFYQKLLADNPLNTGVEPIRLTL